MAQRPAHEREEATRAGCDAFVSKPYLAQDLLDTIGRLLPDEA